MTRGADPVVTKGNGGALGRLDTGNVTVNADGAASDEVVSRHSLDKGGSQSHNGKEGGEVHDY